MSDERLRAKLIEAGYGKDDMDLTEREELLALYADFLVQTQTESLFLSLLPLPWMIIYHPVAVLAVIPN